MCRSTCLNGPAMFRKLFDKGKCLVGLHDGEWKYHRSGECDQVRVCARCSIEQQRIEHVWSDWAFAQEGQCGQKRACTRCGASEARTVHTWGGLRYQSAYSCEQVRDCLRCRAESPIEVRHEWNSWQYAAPDACLQNQ